MNKGKTKHQRRADTKKSFTRGTAQALAAVPQDPLPSLRPQSAGTKSHRRWDASFPPGRQGVAVEVT